MPQGSPFFSLRRRRTAAVRHLGGQQGRRSGRVRRSGRGSRGLGGLYCLRVLVSPKWPVQPKRSPLALPRSRVCRRRRRCVEKNPPGAVQPGERGGCVVPWVGLVMGISYLPSFSTTSIRVRVDRRSSQYLCTSDSYAREIAIDHAKGYTLEKEREFRWPDGNTSSKAMAVARRWPSTEAKDIHYWEERDSLVSAAAPSV